MFREIQPITVFAAAAQLKPETAVLLKKACPTITEEDLKAMGKPPMRGFDSEILKEPNVRHLS